MIRKIGLLGILFVLASFTPAAAYVGPGAGISLLGALWGVLAAIAVALGFVLFWPVRRMLRRRKPSVQASSTADRSAGASGDPAIRNS